MRDVSAVTADDGVIRVCTWNIHGGCDAQGERAFERGCETLRSLRPDLAALQEVPSGGSLARIGDALGRFTLWAPADYGGNGLLTRAAPRDPRVVALDAGGELRSAACARVTLAGVPVLVAATHLDVHRERARCAQYEHLAGALRGATPALLLGDFNALRMADYDPRRREAITAKRALSLLEAPLGDLMERLDGDGWYDLVRLAAAGGDLGEYTAALGAPLPEALAATSRYETRVDYVFGNAALLARFAVTGAFVGDGAASDHRPVVVTLAPRA